MGWWMKEGTQSERKRKTDDLDKHPELEGRVRRFTAEELDRLARVLRLLDSWDRVQRTAKARKAA